MSHSRDTDRILDEWMGDGPGVVADHVIAGAMTEIQTTRQRGARWAPLKELFMTWKHAAVVVGLAAVIIVESPRNSTSRAEVSVPGTSPSHRRS